MTITTSSSPTAPKYTLIFSVPPSHLAACKSAVFACGAGIFDGYEEVCFETVGASEFVPVPVGKEKKEEGESIGVNGVAAAEKKRLRVEEIRVQVLCVGTEVARSAVGAMKRWVHFCFFEDCELR